VCTAGDVNGDGFSDMVALGTTGFDDLLFLYLGSPSGYALAPGYPYTLVNSYSGGSVAAAGDVNGDGYDDIVIGWPAATSGELRVYYGNASGLNTASPFNLIVNFAKFWAQNVGAAGDVNGDGYDDIVVGSPNEDPWINCAATGPDQGRVDVFYGSASGISAANEWMLLGCTVADGAEVGYSVAAAGDVNGDGYGDIIIGAPWAQPAALGTPAGSAWVVYGSAAGLPLTPGYANLGSIAGATRLDSPVAGASFGAAVCGAGDVNGDGYADVAVGAPADDVGATDAGYVRLYAGSATGTQPGNILWYEYTVTANSHFGITLAPAGDVNGDGKGDLLVGESHRVDVAQSYAGGMFINRLLPTDSPGLARTAGDLNGDGFSDIVLGIPSFSNPESGEGLLEVFAGRGDGPSTYPAWSFTSLYDSSNLGWSVAAAGDVNGDGLDDIIVGAPTWPTLSTPSDVDNGMVFLYLGGLAGVAANPTWYYAGATSDQVGISVCGVGDINGDGYADIAVGAHQPGVGNGKVLIFYGHPTGFAATPDLTLTGPSFDSRFGSAVTGGDFNGDGYADVAVGAPYAEAGAVTDAGAAYLYLGTAAGLSGTNAWVGQGGQVGEHFGAALNGFADINADGYTDLVVGSPEMDVDVKRITLVDAGRITEWDGGRGASVLTLRMGYNGSGNEHLGSCVANAGDVNGDGYGDVAVGAPFAAQTIAGQGRALVLAGTGAGLSSTPLWVQLGTEVNGAFGSSVAGAGDVDGDGLSDVLVGGVFEDGGGPADRGSARVFTGPLPAGAPAFWTVYGPSTFANLGHCLANAGDVNGDGWSDVLAGMPGFTNVGNREGRVGLYLGGLGDTRVHLTLARRTPSGPNIAPLGMSAPGVAPVLLHYAPSAGGRTKVKMQWDVQTPVGLPTTPIAGTSAAWTPTFMTTYGQLGAAISPIVGLGVGAPYSWRIRARFHSVYFPSSRWITPARSGTREYDLRAPGNWVDVEGLAAAPAALALSEARPNPMRASTGVSFELPRAGRVTLEVVDLQGRRVRTLLAGDRPAGRYSASWDGRDDAGGPAAAGVYFVRLAAGGTQLGRKVAYLR
jgi:hypothetical protein